MTKLTKSSDTSAHQTVAEFWDPNRSNTTARRGCSRGGAEMARFGSSNSCSMAPKFAASGFSSTMATLWAVPSVGRPHLDGRAKVSQNDFVFPLCLLQEDFVLFVLLGH